MVADRIPWVPCQPQVFDRGVEGLGVYVLGRVLGMFVCVVLSGYSRLRCKTSQI